MGLLAHPFTGDSTSSFETFEKKRLAHKRRTGHNIDDEVAAGVISRNV